MLLVRPYTNDICAHWRFVDEETAIKSSDTIYSMFCGINDGKISLEWTWHGNSLRWDSLVPDGMPITLRDGNMKAMGVYLPARKIASRMSKQEQREIFKKVRDEAAYDPEWLQ